MSHARNEPDHRPSREGETRDTYTDDHGVDRHRDDEVARHEHHDADRHPDHVHHDESREKFGGINWGSAFFGWLVAIAMAILLTSIVGALATAVGSNAEISQSVAEREAGTIGIAAAIVLLVVLLVGYFAGGYVAGRMSRFDGGRQGLAVWIIGLLVTILAVVLGAVFGSQYNILDRVSLPSIPIAGDELGLGALITAAAVLVGTLLAAMLGGKVGHRYHDRVDRAAMRG